MAIDEKKLVPDATLTIREGAVVPWRNYFLYPDRENGSWGGRQLAAMASQWGVDFDIPWKKLPIKQKNLILKGSAGKEMTVNWQSEKIQGKFKTAWEGLMNIMMRRYHQTRSESQKKYYSGFMSSRTCAVCKGKRLKPEVLNVLVAKRSIVDITGMSIAEAYQFLTSLELRGNRKRIAEELIKEIGNRLGFLVNVGLNYLSLDRKGPTLSGGESQRIRLASQVGAELTGVLYILDEPSIGLHQRDNLRLLETLCHLRDIGNTLIVIEHDRETMEASDWIVDIGPGAGLLGGQIVACGTPGQIKRNRSSLTGRFLTGKEKIETPNERVTPRKAGNRWVTVKKASENNLKSVVVKIPLGLMVAVTGVSGAGKSTLVNQILYPALARRLHGVSLAEGKTWRNYRSFGAG